MTYVDLDLDMDTIIVNAKSASMTMVLCIKQQLSNMRLSLKLSYETFKQH